MEEGRGTRKQIIYLVHKDRLYSGDPDFFVKECGLRASSPSRDKPPAL